ncbi:MAG: aminotransferase class I/II-fold pyridoxal phosphate-dependent enzyme [Oscillospiraceae bacterium]|jgi:histidinol-phosphate aminotransferase|nr:aminotransferase class I/II-fold pyridoxal phosphate-dependent enzyme [Oscillospiraceae bacterium]
MPFELNEKLKYLTPYDPIDGDYPVRLDANESFLPTTQAELEVLQTAARHIDMRRYPDPNAIDLCRAAGAYYGVAPELLTAANGSDELLFLIAAAFLGDGKTMLHFALDFSMYRFYANLTGAKCVALPKRADCVIDADLVVNALREHKPNVFIFSNPCNPTGLVLERGAVRKILSAAAEVNTLAVLDEAYMDFSDQSLLGEASAYDHLIILRTASKAVGLAGLRLGFAVANPTLTNLLHAVKSPYNLGAHTQLMGRLLFQNTAIRQGIDAIIASRNALWSALEICLRNGGCGQYKLYIPSANFIFMDLFKQSRADGAFAYLKQNGVIVRHIGQYLRVTAGSKTENAAFLAAWRNYLELNEKV